MNKELVVARISSGLVRVRVDERIYLLAAPSPAQRYEAEEIYDELCQATGMLTDEFNVRRLCEAGYWNKARQTRFEELPRQIENLKLEMYKSFYKSETLSKLREELALVRLEQAHLNQIRYRDDHLTAEGAARLSKARFLTACSLRTETGAVVFPAGAFWKDASGLIDEVLSAAEHRRPSDREVRELARTDPWRSLWALRDSDGLFGVPSSHYTDEQRCLISYSRLYDSIYEHPERPPEGVIEDDDLLDGWMLEQKEKAKAGGAPKSKTTREADIEFVPCETFEDAQRVMSRNSPEAMATMKKRLALIREKGEVDEFDMPDTKMKMRRR